MMNMPSNTASQGAAHAGKAGRPLRECTADLHLHSTFSDGTKTPAELCRMARRAGVETLALCDHDTTAGQPDMAQAARGEGLVLLPGVEVSTGESGSVHVLGYGEGLFDPGMQAFLHQVASDRVSRAERMLDRLDELGFSVPQDARLALLQNPGVGRPHIARALIDMGVVNTVKQAFDRLLARGRPAYVPRQLPTTAEAIRTMRRLKVAPVLAHPLEMGLEWPALTALITEWKNEGLMGLEAYHSSVHAQDARRLDSLARSMGLLVTGGSDYHGDPASTVHIGRLPAGWPNRAEDLSALMKAIQG